MQDTLSDGWRYFSKQAGSEYATQIGSKYVQNVDEAIQKLSDDLNKLGENGLPPKQLKGFVAEFWHGDTFNIDAAVKGSPSRAQVMGSQEHASVDISTNFGKDYSSKYIRTFDTSVKAQAKNVIQDYHSKPRTISLEEYIEQYGYSKDEKIRKLLDDYNNSNEGDLTLEQYIKLHTGEYDITTLLTSVYNGQYRLIPSDQIKDGIAYLDRLIATESKKTTPNRAAVYANYKETLEKLVDRISDGNGVESRTLTKDEAEAIAALIHEGKFKPEDFGISLNDLITIDYIMQQALKAGYSAAIITLVLQLTPEIFKSIDCLIRNKAIDIEQLKRLGVTAVSASAEGFLRGSIASALTVSCMAGKLGPNLINADPHIIGAMTVIVMDTIKNSILVAAGKMPAREMGSFFIREVITSSASLAAGAFVQSLMPVVPVVGYMLGSLLGSCVASAVLEIGSSKLISFCVDSGFTCFGLVKQDYALPEGTLKEMGVDLTEVHHAVISRAKVNHAKISYAQVNHAKVQTVELTMVRRGVIGVNLIGYV